MSQPVSPSSVGPSVRWRSILGLLVVLVLVASSCASSGDSSSEPEPTPLPAEAGDDGFDGIRLASTGTAGPLGVRLSAGAAATTEGPSTPVVQGEPLDEAEIAAVLERLPDWVVPDDDREDFNRPAETLPPPLVGDTIDSPFPASGDPGDGPEVPSGPLEVLRFQPDGEVGIAPFLSVTFNQPMVPLATLEQLDAADVPATLTPDIPGRWRWIGTRTLRFEVEPDLVDRLPMATDFRVEIPAGTRSATGAELAEAVAWEFSTPAVQVESFIPQSQSLPLEPVFFASFDQRVDPAAVLETITLDAGGSATPIRLATDEEIAADDAVDRAVAAALDGRWIAFRPVDPLSPDTPLRVAIGPGTPSAEGPRTTTRAATFEARTFPPLRVVGHRCSYGDDCPPLTPLSIELSNPIDTGAFSDDLVRIDPELLSAGVGVFDSFIEIRGATVGRTTYEVTLDGALRDVFGQTLGDDATVEFRIGPARPFLRGFDRQFVTLDPLAETPTLPVTTVNHDSVRVVAYRVTPEDYQSYVRYLDQFYSDTEPPEPAWDQVLDTVVDIDADDDEITETAIDLTAAVEDSAGQLVVRVEPTREFSPNDDDYWSNRPSVAWVQATGIGIDAIISGSELLLWTTDLATGEPLPDVPVELLGTSLRATTDADGLATVDFGSQRVRGLVAETGGNRAMLPSSWFDGWQSSSRSDESRWYVFDDRGIYRPGETARLKGWVRRFTASSDAQLELLGDGAEVRYTVYDPQGNEIAGDTVAVNALGGFNFSFDVPEEANLGEAYIELMLDGTPGLRDQYASHSVQIQDFRTPEFEVTARAETPGPYFTAEPAVVAVEAEYFAGGPLPAAPVDWTVITRQATYAPPNWDEFSFGIWQPWWIEGDFFARGGFVAEAEYFEECLDCGPGFEPDKVERFSGVTDASGTHYLQIDFDGPEVDLPSTVTAEATVLDVNRQAWTSRTDLVVHAAKLYVGLRSERAFVEQGDPLDIEAIVTDVDGNAVAGHAFTVEAGRLEWQFVDGEWVEVVVEAEACDVTSATEPVNCTFATDEGGSYQITALVADADAHRNRTELTVWVSGGGGVPSRGVQQEAVTIVPDREEYQPGDTAELLVQAPFSPAHGLMTVARAGIVSTTAFEAADGGAVLRVPIEDGYIPNLTVQIDMVGATERTSDAGEPLPDAPPRPAYATGRIDLPVPPITRTLDVTAVPAAAEVEPGADTTVTVSVAADDGSPVAGAELAVVVVDEAVLALTGYTLADPLDVFYGDVYTDFFTEYARASIVLADPELFDPVTQDSAAGGDETAAEDFAEQEAPAAEEAAADGDGAERLGAPVPGAPPIDVRTDFDALAVFAPEERTGADGTVTVDVPLPDNLTRYRIMVVAVDGADHFGTGESTITARLPLMVRPSPPRFLNFGDGIELPVVVQNQTDQPMEVDVAIETANLTLAGGAGQRVTVPADDRVEVRFPADADEAGTARFRVAAVSGSMADAAERELPVYTPATAEAFATYGVVDSGAVAQPLLAPEGVFPQFGGLEIDTSSTALQALTDAVLYLSEYRYESSDALASRILGISALRDVLEAFSAEGLPSASEIDATVEGDVERLVGLQNDDGGFPAWRRGEPSIPYDSIQATHALIAAGDEGYPVPNAPVERALEYLRTIEERFPADYGPAIRDMLSSYALHVRLLAGDPDPDKAADLYRRAGDDLGLDAVAWLWPVLDDAETDDEIERLFLNRATETAGAATFATDYGEDAYLVLYSDRRTDGIVLDALLSERPDSDLVPKVVAGLLGNQVRGRWNNVQENAFILLALNRYFDSFESATPDFVARVWLGDLYAAEHVFEGRTTERNATLVPMDELIAGGDADLVVAKDGPGRLYYRLGLRYAPDDLNLAPRDEGFVVERVYEAVEDPGEVRRDENGVWYVAAGATVRVRLSMVADARRTHVALIDPLPAGLEPVNPALAVSPEPLPDDVEDAELVSVPRWCYCLQWFEHQNLRDDRAEAFTSLLGAGTYEYTYLARATTPGTFVVPPARAEEIYAPEVFGRGASATVVVESELLPG